MLKFVTPHKPDIVHHILPAVAEMLCSIFDAEFPKLEATNVEGESQAKTASGQPEWTLVRGSKRLQPFKATSSKKFRLQSGKNLPVGWKQLCCKQLNPGLPSLLSINRFSAIAGPNHHDEVQEQEICFLDILKSSPKVSRIPKGGKWRGRPCGIQRMVNKKRQRKSQRKARGQVQRACDTHTHIHTRCACGENYPPTSKCDLRKTRGQ
jgi:hypothetical protein